jgi:hypothetical protein
MQERLRGGELQLRVGVHQGDVVVEDDDLSRTHPEMQIPPGSASAFNLTATFTPSPNSVSYDNSGAFLDAGTFTLTEPASLTLLAVASLGSA